MNISRARPGRSVTVRAAGQPRSAGRKGGPRQNDGCRPSGVPLWFAVRPLQQVGRRSFDPLRAGPGRRPGPTSDWSPPALPPSPTGVISWPTPTRAKWRNGHHGERRSPSGRPPAPRPGLPARSAEPGAPRPLEPVAACNSIAAPCARSIARGHGPRGPDLRLDLAPVRASPPRPTCCPHISASWP